jgi:hypothetical protein
MPVIAKEPIIAASHPASASNNSWFCRSSGGRRLAPATTTPCAVLERHGSATIASRTPGRGCQVTWSILCALAWARNPRYLRADPVELGGGCPRRVIVAVHGLERTQIARKVGGRCRRDLCGCTAARKGVRSPLSLRPRYVVRAAAGHFLRHRV